MFYAMEYTPVGFDTYAVRSIRKSGFKSLAKASLALSKITKEHQTKGELYEYGKGTIGCCSCGRITLRSQVAQVPVVFQP